MTSTLTSKNANYRIDIPVRISDINYGGHLGHAELIKIIHQARLKFFSEFSLEEHDIGGTGIIVKSLSVDYRSESFFDDILHIAVFINKIDKAFCDFYYEVTKENNKPVATVMEKILFMNYKTRRLKRVPSIIYEMKEKISC